MINPSLDDDDPTRTLLIKLTDLVGSWDCDMAAAARGETDAFHLHDTEGYRSVRITADELAVFRDAGQHA